MMQLTLIPVLANPEQNLDWKTLAWTWYDSQRSDCGAYRVFAVILYLKGTLYEQCN